MYWFLDSIRRVYSGIFSFEKGGNFQKEQKEYSTSNSIDSILYK